MGRKNVNLCTCILFNLAVPKARIRRHVLFADNFFLTKFETTTGTLHRQQHLRQVAFNRTQIGCGQTRKIKATPKGTVAYSRALCWNDSNFHENENFRIPVTQVKGHPPPPTHFLHNKFWRTRTNRASHFIIFRFQYFENF